MKNNGISVSQNQKLATLQTQKLTMQQIQSLNLLSMNVNDLREEIYNFVNKNPALEIVKDSYKDNFSKNTYLSSNKDTQLILEQTQDYEETLQEHLLAQLNMQNLAKSEYELCFSLIHNLDKNGFYGSMLDPSSFVTNYSTQKGGALINKCLKLIQSLDPIGTCCKNAEESLYIQAKHKKNPPKIALFILEKPERLEILNPPIKENVYKKLKQTIEELQKQSFGMPLIISQNEITLEAIQESIDFIKKLNPFPASNFGYSHSIANQTALNVVLTIEEINQPALQDDESSGILYGDQNTSFRIKYANGTIPEIRINPDYETYLAKKDKINKEYVNQAKQFLQSLEFCKNTIALQGYAIAKYQRQFLLKGPKYLEPLTRKQIAQYCKIHESTVSRMTSKKNSKFIQTKWGIFPASYFFSSAIKTQNGQLSSVKIKNLIEEIINSQLKLNNKTLSDNQLTQILNQKGIQIARRTVTKYRTQLNIQNSYQR